MATRQIRIDLGRGTPRSGWNILTGDTPSNLTLQDPVDINGVQITGVAFTVTSSAHVNTYFEQTRPIHDSTAPLISWLDVDALESKFGAGDTNPIISITATGLGTVASFVIVTQNGFTSPTPGTLTVNTETTGVINLNFNSTNSSDPNYQGSPTTFTNVAANGSNEFVISMERDNSDPRWNAILVTFDDSHLGGGGGNGAPVGNNDTATTSENNSVNINVLGNDTDPDGDSLSVTLASASNGTVVIEANDTLTYTPNNGFTGSDTITYTVSDGTDTDTATVTVTVSVGGGGGSLTAPIPSPNAQSQLITAITDPGPLFAGFIAANPGLNLIGLGAFTQPRNGATPTYDLATGTWSTLTEDTTWDVYIYNGVWSSASVVSAQLGQSSSDVLANLNLYETTGESDANPYTPTGMTTHFGDLKMVSEELLPASTDTDTIVRFNNPLPVNGEIKSTITLTADNSSSTGNAVGASLVRSDGSGYVMTADSGVIAVVPIDPSGVIVNGSAIVSNIGISYSAGDTITLGYNVATNQVQMYVNDVASLGPVTDTTYVPTSANPFYAGAYLRSSGADDKAISRIQGEGPAVNASPAFVAQEPDLTIIVNQTGVVATVSGNATDADGDSLTYSFVSGQPTGFTMAANGEISHDGNASPGLYKATYQVSDGIDSVQDVFYIQVNAIPMSLVSAPSVMEKNSDVTVTILNPAFTPTTSNTTLVSGGDTLVCTGVVDQGSNQYILTFAVGDLSKQVSSVGYTWQLRIENI